MQATLIILAVTVILFIHGKIRSDLVAFTSMLSLILTGILTPSEALASFGDPIIFVIIGLFIVSAGVFRTGLAKIIGSRIIRLAGSNEISLYILMMLVACFMGVFVTATGTVALLIPIIVSMSVSRGISVTRYLMPLSFVAGIGSFFTMINSSNLASQRVLVNEGYGDLKFFSMAPLGLIAALVAAVVLWWFSKFLAKRKYGESSKKGGKSFDELAQEYRLSDKTFFAEVQNDSPLIGKALKLLNITGQYRVSIVQVIRRGRNRRNPLTYELAGPYTMLLAGDKIEIIGLAEDVEAFTDACGLVRVYDVKVSSALGIAEVLLMPTSKLAGVKVEQSGFREKYRVNILAINRKGEYITKNLREELMHRGDALLVQGSWSDLARLDEDHANLVVVGRPLEEAENLTIDHKAPLAGLILIVMIALIATDALPTVTAVLLAAVAMIVTGCLRNLEEGYSSINWSGVVIIASMMPMSTALHKTGIDIMISAGLVDLLGGMGHWTLLAGLYACISVMTFFINGTPLAVLFAPIGFQIAVSAGVSPYPFLVAVAAAANLYFTSPFSSTTNIMVAAAGRYKPVDFLKVGLPLQLLLSVLVLFMIPVFFPF